MIHGHGSVIAGMGALALGLAPQAIQGQGSWDAMLSIQPFPSPYFSDWDQNPNIGSLTIINHTTTSEAVRIFFTITDRMNRVIASGTSDPEMIAAGAIATYDSPYQIAGSGSHDEEFERIASRTGRLPEGDYTACAAAADDGGFVLAEACADFFIAYPDPPLLLAPNNGEEVLEELPLFQWTPVQVPIEYQLTYALRIVEVLDGQLPGEALAANIPVYEERDAFSTALRYPMDARPLEPDRTYAWSVQAVDQHGYTASANDGRSEIWTFRVDDPDGPVTDPGPWTLTLSNTSDPAPASSAESLQLSQICHKAKASASGPLRLEMDVDPAFLPGSTEFPVTLDIDPKTKEWALLYLGEEGDRNSILLYGKCDVGGPLGGLQWIARRSAGLAEFGVDEEGAADEEEAADEEGADDEEALGNGEDASDEADESAVSARDLEVGFGVLILALYPMTVGKDMPAGFEEPVTFLGGREIKVKEGINVYFEVDLASSGPLATLLQALGHTEPRVEIQGFIGAGTSFSVGGHIGRTHTPDQTGTAVGAGAQAEVEVTLATLSASLSRRPPMVLGSHIEWTQVGVHLNVKAKGTYTLERPKDGTWPADVKIGAAVSLALAMKFKDDGPTRTASVGFTTAPAAVIKVESDRRFEGLAPVIFNSPELAIEVDLAQPFKGVDAVKVKVAGQVGIGEFDDLGKGSLEISRRSNKPGPRGGDDAQSRIEEIRANIARMEAEQKAALDDGETARAEEIGKQLDLERNALVSWQLAAQRPPPTDTTTAATTAERAWHWKAEVALGNLSLSEMLRFVAVAATRIVEGR